MMKADLALRIPPGVDLDKELAAVRTALIVSSVYFIGCFLVCYNAAWHNTFTKYFDGTWQAVKPYMDTCAHVLRHCYLGFLLSSILAGFGVVYHYSLHWAGSKSIYTMRRLKNPMELHIRCWTLPLLAVVLFAASALVLKLLCFGLYMLITPDEYTAANQWREIWS